MNSLSLFTTLSHRGASKGITVEVNSLRSPVQLYVRNCELDFDGMLHLL